jgi:hypothetical protein
LFKHGDTARTAEGDSCECEFCQSLAAYRRVSKPSQMLFAVCAVVNKKIADCFAERIFKLGAEDETAKHKKCGC